MPKQIVIVDYGMGNLRSVVNAFKYVGARVKLSNKSEDIIKASAIVVPGQGAFKDCMKNLNKQKLTQLLEHEVIKKKKPYFGICLGMQILGTTSFEGGRSKGLNWIEGEVKKIQPKKSSFKIPHLGWNDIQIKRSDPIFNGLSAKPCFYFAHSYALFPKQKKDVVAVTNYGGIFPVALQRNNIVAVQFHPEKSQQDGLKLIKNFLTKIN